ncbi:hypothetical protein DERP_001939 [Dermatophagoides pteronyssinus]|uniref:Uncharacterized protein n=1 Tax=Dermatophagoides pteronyssinus TaxID=6956 RepID=A0ABQ8JBY0_DERPT|nr:hypothetical protein DERP_001939 [Dermatophagoides pteronyssinus]
MDFFTWMNGEINRKVLHQSELLIVENENDELKRENFGLSSTNQEYSSDDYLRQLARKMKENKANITLKN